MVGRSPSYSMICLAGSPARVARSRTAYLHINYRSVTPLDRELQLHGSIERVEGRKIFVAGSVRDDETLVSEAEGLWVILWPGQP
jgi:acyl-coenzyme A thioesterase PaaI-like protein